MHDGDQQLFNPFGHHSGEWTCFSFRPKDTLNPKTEEAYPQIAITPASFEAIESLHNLLNEIPYIVVREYFFKNVASTMNGVVTALLTKANTAAGKVKETAAAAA